MLTNEDILDDYDEATEALGREKYERHSEPGTRTEFKRARAAVLASMCPDWEPISTAPTNGCAVLLWNGVTIALGAHATHKVRQAPWRDGHSLGSVLRPQPTHWMPLPDAPASGAPR